MNGNWTTEETEPLPDPATVAIVGCGSIGTAFALVFARAGFSVRVWDAAPTAFERAREDLGLRLALLDEHRLLTEDPGAIVDRVSFCADPSQALQGAVLVQECAPEDIDLKRNLFRRLAELSEPTAVLASSSSALVPSSFASTLNARSRIIVGHPGNPPYLIPIIEVVPSAHTSADTVRTATAIYRAAGLKPIQVRREVEGFVFNRLQGALLREAYCLLRDGVASVQDIDEVVRSGLGPRWNVIGPFETVDLNTRGGIEAHAGRMGPAYERMGAERGQHDPWTAELVAQATEQRRALLPLSEWEGRVAWRDEQLMKNAQHATREAVDNRT